MTELSDKRVWIAGQHGMVGNAMMRRLEREGCALLRDPGRPGLDLRRQSEVEDWVASQRPQVVVLTAGRVGAACAPMTLSPRISFTTTCSLRRTSSTRRIRRVSKNFCSSAPPAFIRARLPSRFPRKPC